MRRLSAALIIALASLNPAAGQEIDRVRWAGAFTNLCLQEVYSNTKMMEALAMAQRTAQSVCGCGADVMAATIRSDEIEFFWTNKRLRTDTFQRWRKALVS